MNKKFTSIMSAAVLFGSLFQTTGTAAAASCTTYTGSNIEYQNYQRWSSPITSYLTSTDNDQLMRVQYGAGMNIGGILIEYYNSSYQLTDTKILPQELPIFGGFYETATNYFILTGQTNHEESPDTEVFRITKYDKSWNRISSAGLYDCNTTVPFDAGSARMDAYGKYLLIRTCHKMYTSEDGLNHQANVTIQVDTEKMQITDSFTQVMNISYGYVSHSFNQFIKVENGHIIAADHGDAYPRSIALIKYTTDVSDGSFVPNYGENCISKDILSFPGGIGNNSTGASLGGFELSDTSYLIAGNSVIQDENNLSRTARNVFVASADKDTLNTEIHWLTSYKDGDGTVSTPQMVKIDQNRFLVLWSKDDNVYYTEVDKSGKTTGDTYSLEAHLSDCVPIIFNNKLIWYTWNQEKMTFYEINLNNYAETSEKEIITGHQFKFSKISDGTVYLVCSVCGEEKQQPATENIIMWWQDGNMWTTRLPDSLTVGDKLHYLLSCYPDGSDDEIDILIGDTSIAEYIPGENNSGTLKMLKAGKTTVTARSKWNPDVSIEYSLNVKGRDGQVLYGDANSDGEVDSKDAVLVKKYLAGYSGLSIDKEAADVNGDGEVDSKDAVRLLRHLAGYDVELGGQR